MRLTGGEGLQNAEPIFQARLRDLVLGTEAAHHRGVERGVVVGARDDGYRHTFAQDCVHRLQHLRLCAVHGRLVVVTSVAHESVDLVKEEDAGASLARNSEGGSDELGRLAKVLVLERAERDAEEGHARLVRKRACEHRLARAGRAVEEQRARRRQLGAIEEDLRVAEREDDAGVQLFLELRHAADSGDSHVDVANYAIHDRGVVLRVADHAVEEPRRRRPLP